MMMMMMIVVGAGVGDRWWRDDHMGDIDCFVDVQAHAYGRSPENICKSKTDDENGRKWLNYAPEQVIIEIVVLHKRRRNSNKWTLNIDKLFDFSRNFRR